MTPYLSLYRPGSLVGSCQAIMPDTFSGYLIWSTSDHHNFTTRKECNYWNVFIWKIWLEFVSSNHRLFEMKDEKQWFSCVGYPPKPFFWPLISVASDLDLLILQNDPCLKNINLKLFLNSIWQKMNIASSYKGR